MWYEYLTCHFYIFHCFLLFVQSHSVNFNLPNDLALNSLLYFSLEASRILINGVDSNTLVPAMVTDGYRSEIERYGNASLEISHSNSRWNLTRNVSDRQILSCDLVVFASYKYSRKFRLYVKLPVDFSYCHSCWGHFRNSIQIKAAKKSNDSVCMLYWYWKIRFIWKLNRKLQ